LADEPTGNLDAATGAEVASLMFRLNEEHGTTLVLVTHDELIATRCRRRLSLASGRLIADELMNEPVRESVTMSAGGPLRGANCAPLGGSERSERGGTFKLTR